MSEADRFLRELRRALPIGCRRRFVTELRDHFASAAEAGEPEHLTIERLGPPRALAEQLLTDLRSGSLGRGARLTAGLTSVRVAVVAAVVAIAIGVGAIFSMRHSSPAPSPTPQRAAYASPTITLDPRTGEVRAVVYAVQNAVRLHERPLMWTVKAVPFYVTQAPPKN